MQIPIIINNRNRVTYLQRLLNWFWSAGHSDITIIDNHSTYPPLLSFYQLIEKDVKIIYMGNNIGPWALWHWTNESLTKPPFLYTDPDVVPAEDCPLDIVNILFEIATQYSNEVCKAGLGLDIRDIPVRYSQCRHVEIWEGQFWNTPIAEYKGVKLYRESIDTTFAVYTKRDFSKTAIRTGYPYVAKHLPWYVDSKNPSEEDLYYEQHSKEFLLGWHINNCSPFVVQKYKEMC